MKSRLPIIFITSLLVTSLAAALFFSGCGVTDNQLPIQKIINALREKPSFSIILEDMKKEGNFVPRHLHKYRIVIDNESQTTDWLVVPLKYYKDNQAYLGMTLISKKDGEINSTANPPGFEHVGDKKYGNWVSDSRGGSFWEFYGKYALFSTLLGGLHRPIYRNDYNSYRRYRNSNLPYFGGNNQYGTNGSLTKKTRPNFYSRYNKKKRMSANSFSNRVAERTGRTRTGFRSRGGGFGK